MKIISCDCWKDCIVEYCNENYPLDYFLGKYNIIEKDIVIEHGIDFCPYCGNKIEVSNE